MTIYNQLIPQAASDLTPAWLTMTLRAGGTLDADTAVVTARATPIGNGKVGQVLLTALTYSTPGAGPASLIAKLPALDEGRRAMAAAHGLYDTEVRFYQDIAPRVDIATPRLYGSASEPGTGRFALLLEDLASTAEVGDTVAGASTGQAAAALAALPGLQAPLWDSEQLTTDSWWGDHGRSHILFTLVPQILPVLMESFGPRLNPEHVDFMVWVASVADRLPAQVWTAPFVVAHGDYRLDNMLFGVTPGSAAVTVIDWQAARLAPPLADVALFLATNLDAEARRRLEPNLVRSYHRGLLSAGIDCFTFEDVWARYRLCALYPACGAMVSAASLAITEEDARFWAQLLRQSLQMAIDLDTVELID